MAQDGSPAPVGQDMELMVVWCVRPRQWGLLFFWRAADIFDLPQGFGFGQDFEFPFGPTDEDGEAFRLGKPHFNEGGVLAFEVGEHLEFEFGGVVTEVPFGVGVHHAPLFGGCAEDSSVEQVGLGGEIDGFLFGIPLHEGDDVFPDAVGMNGVVRFGEFPPEVPGVAKAFGFFLFEAFELYDKIEVKFDIEPVHELDGDFFVGIGAAVPAGFRLDTDGPGGIDPVFHGKVEVVEAYFGFNPHDSVGIKIGVAQFFPLAEELQVVGVFKIGLHDDVGRGIGAAGDIGQTKENGLALLKIADRQVFNDDGFDGCFFPGHLDMI